VNLRTPTEADAPAVFDLVEARDRLDLGFPDFTFDDLIETWRASDFDLSADAALIEDHDGRIVAYADVVRHGGVITIAPGHDGQGADRRLLVWSEQRERTRGNRVHRQRIAATNQPARQLLLDAGYAYARFTARMVLPLSSVEQPPAVPSGLQLRTPDPLRDGGEMHALDALAFGGAPDYVPESLSEFTEEHLQAHDHDSSLGCIAVADGRVVGFIVSRRWTVENVGYVSILAVHPDYQRRGIGTAMLRRAFSLYGAAGLAEAQLTVASDNPGARGLYERLGMLERFRYEVYERPLDFGRAPPDSTL
jgi:mycothiol synthase